jgi:sporulation protein YlmC with PRC-barrel domain
MINKHYKSILNLKFILNLLFVILICLNSFAVAEEQPDGTIVIDEFQVMLLVGGSEGHGTILLNEGGSHSFKVSGLRIGGIGAHKVHLVGEVYNLKNVGDLEGDYISAQAGATVGTLGTVMLAMKNKKGVKLHLKASKSEGIALDIGVEGFSISDVH